MSHWHLFREYYSEMLDMLVTFNIISDMKIINIIMMINNKLLNDSAEISLQSTESVKIELGFITDADCTIQLAMTCTITCSYRYEHVIKYHFTSLCLITVYCAIMLRGRCTEKQLFFAFIGHKKN